MVFKDELDHRTVKFGMAAGMLLPINRAHNLRPELGLYEIGIAHYLKRLVAGASVGYDIGSHMGFYVLAMCRADVSRVVAFEPDEPVAARLRDTVAVNDLTGRVDVIERFVSDHDDERFVSVDRLVADAVIPPPDFVKMDIDGGELDALMGMRETIERLHPSFIIETHSVGLERECIRCLVGLGYSEIHVVDNGPVITGLLPEKRDGVELNRWLVAWVGERVAKPPKTRRGFLHPLSTSWVAPGPAQMESSG